MYYRCSSEKYKVFYKIKTTVRNCTVDTNRTEHELGICLSKNIDINQFFLFFQ